MGTVRYSIIIPVYKNIESLPRLIEELSSIVAKLKNSLEVVFVIDGSPDRSLAYLEDALIRAPFPSQLLSHSRNFGSFLAIRNGLLNARGTFFCVMAADLQEPVSLAVEMFLTMETGQYDVAVAKRLSRGDPFLSKISSECFWWLYRRLVVPEMPKGGVDVFGCNLTFRDRLLDLEESRSSLVALIFWLGFKRVEIGYHRRRRLEGESAWTLRKKLAYLGDSICAFTDLPIRSLIWVGGAGLFASLVMSMVVGFGKLLGLINVPGYAATIVFIAFIGSANLLATGIVGIYSWRGYENSKRRPLGVIAKASTFSGLVKNL